MNIDSTNNWKIIHIQLKNNEKENLNEINWRNIKFENSSHTKYGKYWSIFIFPNDLRIKIESIKNIRYYKFII